MREIVEMAHEYMSLGIYDQHMLFTLIQPHVKKHYSTIRTGIHLAKSSLYAHG